MISAPLAERMRPKTLDEYIGQEHIFATDASLRRAIDSGMIPSMILWGPPGVGKTTLAHLIAKHLERPFHTLSAISSGVKDVREIISNIEKGGLFQAKGTILFIDEIHRFSKSQQDSLLGAVEKGVITLIGATTENPSFEVISALLSRCQVYKLEDHTKSDLLKILEKSIQNDPAFASKNINLLETNALLSISSGDARKLLNVFEIMIKTESNITISFLL
jgi:putative ATPase